MAPELRKRSKSTTAKEPAVKKTEKVTKRKAAEDASPVTVKKQKAVKETSKTKTSAEDTPVVKKTKKTSSKTSKPEEEPEEVVTEETETALVPADDEEVSAESADDEEIDAEIRALAAGLDPEEDGGPQDDASVFQPGQDVGQIPNKLSKKEKKALAAQKAGKKEEPGVIYVGRLPHGFYEHELRGYFSQFGPVNKVRLSRNKQTGRSKHYAFIEFAEESTAIIAQKTMDKYLLFGHILTVQFVPKDKLHPEIWKGANRRFKKTPWSKVLGNRLARPLTESKWESKISKEEKKRADRAKKLKEIGYEFEAPQLKQAPAPPVVEAIEGAEEPKAIEAAPVGETDEEAKAEVEASAETSQADKSKKTKATTKKKQVKKAKA